jgi:hypothetical protein
MALEARRTDAGSREALGAEEARARQGFAKPNALRAFRGRAL